MLKNASIEKMKEVNQKAGFYFFGKSEMKGFNSRIITGSNNYGMFITSEKDGSKQRLYTIRFISSNGNIETVGKFQEYSSIYYAKKEMNKLVKTFNELKKCYLENEILKNITAIYKSYDYPNCIEIFNETLKEKQGMIFNMTNYTVSGYLK